MKNSELIEEFKGLIFDACLDIALIQLERERAIHDNEIMLSAQKNLVKISNNLRQTIYSSDYLDLQLQIENISRLVSDKSSCLTKRSHKFLRPGKSKIFFAISIELLKIIDICEVNNIDLSWLKEYLRPDGELYTSIKCMYPIKSDIMLPIPTYATNDKQWVHRMKETLQRSLFSGEENVLKKKSNDFLIKREEFYEGTRNANDEIYLGYNLKRS